MLIKQKAKENLRKLVEKFRSELEANKIYDYNEEATKIAFIQPLLRDVLGWDITNRDEVSPEESTSRGRVDYGLRFQGQFKIFIETKAPKVDLTKEKPISQAVRYGYSRREVHFVLLTDFEEFELFDVTIKPDERNIRRGLKVILRWDQYLDKFDTIWLLSKESVANGRLDSLLLTKPKERFPVDKAILNDLRRWQELLSKDIYKNNFERFHTSDYERDAHYLKEITQKILDRVIFMRSCEDRGLIYRRPLREVFEERAKDVGLIAMSLLKEEFKHYNIIFNSDLFQPQEWEDKLSISFKVMHEILIETYSPYQFDAIPVDVLGYIYEQYLGYTIKFTDQHVKYELKPDVRKAGGVYYTPEYIVNYIIKSTVGRILEETSLKKIKRIRILDPACGSGSFLIKAYEEMMNYYLKHKEGRKNTGDYPSLPFEYKEIAPKLSIYEKSEILKNHIFGVDVDDQAVEITKLSLVLKMLEGEYGVIPGRAILPMLDSNIRCGNSLIFGESLVLKEYFGDLWFTMMPFDWSRKFDRIMIKEGGFSIVIGNPPYVQLSMEKNLEKGLKKYLIRQYGSSMGRLNTFGFFIKLGINLLQDKGELGFIIPNTILTQDYYEELRGMILDSCKIQKIVSFEDLPFKDAVIENVVLTVQKVKSIAKRKQNKVDIYTVDEKGNFEKKNEINQSLFQASPKLSFNIKFSKKDNMLRDKINQGSEPLKKFLTVNQAIALKHARDKWVTKEKSVDNLKPLLVGGKNINRYSLNWDRSYLKYDLEGIHSCKREDIFLTKQKIFFRRVANRLIATLDEQQFYGLHTLVVMNIKRGVGYDIKYLLALFNSSLLTYYYRTVFASTKKIFTEIGARQVEQLPIKMLDLANPNEKRVHDDIVALVDIMLKLNNEAENAVGNEKKQFVRQMEKVDKEIDKLIYRIYCINQDEEATIEGLKG